MIVKLHLIFTLYSLCASVFKGERRALPWRRGVVCGEAAAAAALWCCPKAACAHVSRAREFNYNSRERELLCFIFYKNDLRLGGAVLASEGKGAAVVRRQSRQCWNAWKLTCAAQPKAQCGCTSCAIVVVFLVVVFLLSEITLALPSAVWHTTHWLALASSYGADMDARKVTAAGRACVLFSL